MPTTARSEEHTSELQSPDHLVCRLLLEKKKNTTVMPLASSKCFFVSLMSQRLNLLSSPKNRFFTTTLPLKFVSISCFFFNDTATPEIYTLSLHDALPICDRMPFGAGKRRRDRCRTRTFACVPSRIGDLRCGRFDLLAPRAAHSEHGDADCYGEHWEGDPREPRQRPFHATTFLWIRPRSRHDARLRQSASAIDCVRRRARSPIRK